ncbi:MAG: hypothetical protein NDI61_12020, partial [Bdellovibrionaceae bacterium]|nr:hypothetical protein [Pseudobdellovibrionaceae bacterium]
LLRPGLHQFSYNLGFPATPEAGRYEYDQDRLTLSASHRAGYSPTLTFGAFAQGNRDQSVGGLEALTVNTFGLYRLETAASQLNTRSQRSGAAVRLAYRSLQDSAKAGPLGWGFQLESRSQTFAQLGELEPTPRFHERVEGFLNLRVSSQITSTVGAYQDWTGRGIPQTKGSYINSSVAVNAEWLLGLDLSASDEPGVRRERRVFATLRWRDAEKPLLIGASADSRESARRVEASFSGERLRADANITTTGHSDSGTDSGSANVSAILQRMQVGYGLVATRTRVDNDDTDSGAAPEDIFNTTSLFQLGAALTYADGAIALSRPVTESFALVGDSGENWQRGIAVNPTEDAYAGQVDGLGPATISDLQAYRLREIVVDTSPLQSGMSLEQERFHVIPGYRSGYHLKLRLLSIVVAQGRLLLPDGQPAALLSGDLRPVGSDVAREFFTDRDGQFEADGLNPGEYELRMYVEKYAPLKLTIPAGTRGTISIGDLKLRRSND